MIDHSLVLDDHHCRPPDIIVWGETEPGSFGTGSLVVAHPEGTRFHCEECEAVHLVYVKPDRVGRYVVIVGGLRWRRETKRERRRRLGQTGIRRVLRRRNTP